MTTLSASISQLASPPNSCIDTPDAPVAGRRARRGREARARGADRRRHRSRGRRRDALGREVAAELRAASSRPVTVRVGADPAASGPSSNSTCSSASSSSGVGAGPDEVVRVGELGGLGAARVDDHHLAAALADRLAGGRVTSGRGHQAAVGGSGLAPRISRYRCGRCRGPAAAAGGRTSAGAASMVRQLVDRGGGEAVARAERAQKQLACVSRPRGCARSGCRGRRPTASAPWRARTACSLRGDRRTPRPSRSRASVPPSRRSGRRSRSGSSWRSASAVALGQMWPRLNGSSRSPRIGDDAPAVDLDGEAAHRLAQVAGAVVRFHGRLPGGTRRTLPRFDTRSNHSARRLPPTAMRLNIGRTKTIQ